jgi:RimJ/RimL family protein N-acetyltransferase
VVLGEYGIYYIYTRGIEQGDSSIPETVDLKFVRVDQSAVESSTDESILRQVLYHGTQSLAYACVDGDRIVAVCYFWHGDRYRERNFWPLSSGEAKLVQIVTIPEMQGRGIAPRLIGYASRDMFQQGFQRLFARIWHSNLASRKAFQRAGWRQVALVVEGQLLGRGRILRLTARPRRPIASIEFHTAVRKHRTN